MGKLSKSCSWRSVWLLCLLILPLVILLPYLNTFPYPNPETTFSDLTISHYPQARYLRTVLWTDHRLPLWSPNILSGHPIAGNPLSGLWYPPGWLALITPLPFGFNLGVLLHLLWGGVGMVSLARQEGRSRLAALFAGLVVVGLPKLYAHYGAGHLTLLYAVSWTPWLLYTARRSYESNAFPGFPAMVMALIILADPRWAAISVALWWAYALLQKKNEQIDRPIQQQFALLGTQSLLALGLAAPFIIPFIKFVNLSSRVSMTPDDVFSFSLPPERLLGLVFPDFGGFHEWILYPGAIVILLVLLALVWQKSMVGANFWFWILLLSILISLGSFLPFSSTIGQLPVVRLLRVPSRTLFVSGIAMSILAAYSIDYLLNQDQAFNTRSSRLLLVFVASLVFVLGLAGWFIGGEASLGFLWGGLAIIVGAVWITLGINKRIHPETWFLFLVILCLVDWGWVDRSLFDPRPAKEIFTEKVELATYLAEQPGLVRVYSPSYSLPQHTAADFGLQLADGVDPLQLQSYVNFMKKATGVPWDGYSVTLPPFENGEPQFDNATYQPNPKMLGWLNVHYLAAEFEISVEGFEFIQKIENTYLYRNTQTQPRAWVQSQMESVGESTQSADHIKWMPERIELSAAGPGVLVLSELAYPGWRVWVDGKEKQVVTIEDLLRGVQLDAGEHKVIFEYRPSSTYLGLGLFLMVCILLVILYFRNAGKFG